METNEVGYRDVPLSSPRFEVKPAELTVVQNTETLPRELVQDVQVNEYAAQLLHPSVKHLASKEELLRLARITIPPTEEGQEKSPSEKAILGVVEWNRALPLAYGVIPYAEGRIGNVVFGKGGNISGYKYITEENRVEEIDSSLDTNDIPWGFYESSGAAVDTAVTNYLLSNNCRTSLALGTIILNPQELKKYVQEKWKNTPKIAEQLVKNITMIEEHGDQPAILIRVGGVPDRLHRSYYDEKVDDTHNRERAAVVWGNKVLLEELNSSSQTFQQYLQGIPTEAARQLFTKVAEKQKLNEEEKKQYRKLITQILITDSERMITAIQQKPQWTAACNLYHQEKDLDYALLHYDFEEANDQIIRSPDEIYASLRSNTYAMAMNYSYLATERNGDYLNLDEEI